MKMSTCSQALSPTPGPYSSSASPALAACILALWLCGCGFAFWWFQFRQINSFDNYLATFDGAALAAVHLGPLKSKHATVVYFSDPDCPCSRFSAPHIKRLESTFGDNVIIATSAHQQSIVVGEISQNLTNILDAARSATQESIRAASSASTLRQVAENLDQLSRRFNVSV